MANAETDVATNTAAPLAGPPTISVIIPHLNDLGNLVRCIAALERQTIARTAFEIVVGDNGSATGLAAVAAAIPAARVAAVAERGAGPARNGAVAASRGAVLAFTDSDCLPDPDWLAQGLAALSQSQLAGGHVRVGVGDPSNPTPAEAFEAVFAFDNRGYVERKGFTVTANLFVTRAVFDAVGGFRAGISEDVEWCRRATALGNRLVFAPGPTVTHPARATFAELLAKWRRTNGEAFQLWHYSGGTRLGWAIRAAAVLASPIVHAFKLLGSRELPNWQARRGALAVLVAIRTRRAGWMLAQALRPAVSTIRDGATLMPALPVKKSP